MFDSRFLFRALIFGQPLFWMWLYDRDVDLSAYRNTFYFFSGSFCLAALIKSVTDNSVFEYYTAWLLFLYAFMVIFVTWGLEEKFSFRKSVCLGFLLVYLNSYVWEFMLHITSYMTHGICANDLLQMQHLIVLPWLLMRFRLPLAIDKKKVLNGIQWLLACETVIAIFIIEVVNKSVFILSSLNGFLLNFNRVFSIAFLLMGMRFLAIDKNYKGVVYVFKQGVASVTKSEDYLDKGISRNRQAEADNTVFQKSDRRAA